jgi:hypothetical protein
MANTTTGATGRKRIKRGPGKRMVDGKSFRLADEVRYIQRRAAEHDERIVTVGQLVLFSTETGAAWLLDAHDHLAARLARDGDPEPIHTHSLKLIDNLIGTEERLKIFNLEIRAMNEGVDFGAVQDEEDLAKNI